MTRVTIDFKEKDQAVKFCEETTARYYDNSDSLDTLLIKAEEVEEMKDEAELTYGEHKERDTFWDDVKEPFPEMNEIEWVMAEATEWYPVTYVTLITAWTFGYKYDSVSQDRFNDAIKLHENSQDFKVTWKLKQKEPHADLKAEYEKALTEHDVVKVYIKFRGYDNFELLRADDDFEYIRKNPVNEYQFRYYNISWNKVADWQTQTDEDGNFINEAIECEFSSYEDFKISHHSRFKGTLKTYKTMFINGIGSLYPYVALPEGAKIEEAWLVEIKK